MRLKQLKLAGFKSFVEPTVIPFPSQLVGVVGPNGCGKSNVIDAVRWVMGESSAKNLRGESMVDVIFNGSSSRKAVGQASVELVFDNSMGRLVGQYASYQEIAVKRLVTRDGDSAYFLNGTRCRRRDITDIFLGTGAGARGYSIIGQGTISRLVEARPEELRAYLEEAAGISKYKERRRETLTRITHTRENLARVADIREELSKQLQRIERQARAAERYQILKSEERACKADIISLKWQALNEEQQALEQQLMLNKITLEQHHASAQDAYNHTITLREKIQEENENQQSKQVTFYQLTTDIALLEESIQQRTRDKQRLLSSQQQIQSEWLGLSEQLQQDAINLQTSEANFAHITSQLQSMRASLTEHQHAFQEAEQQQVSWQKQSEDVQLSQAKAQHKAEVAQVTLKNLKQRRHETTTRFEKLQEEKVRVNDELSSVKFDELQAARATLQTSLQEQQFFCQAQQLQATQWRTQLADIEIKLHKEQDNLYGLKAEQAALAAMIRSKTGQEQPTSLRSHQWSQHPRLIEKVLVEGAWQRACEFVFGADLNAIVVDSMEAIWPQLNTLFAVSETFTTPVQNQSSVSKYPRLSDKIQGVKPGLSLNLDNIFAAQSVTEACQWLPFIKDDESIITPECCWMGKGWLRMICASDNETVSILASQEKLNNVNGAVISSEEKVSDLIIKRDEGHVSLKEHENGLILAQKKLVEIQEELRACVAKISNQERLLEQWHATLARLHDEQEELQECLEEIIIPLESTEQSVQEALRTMIEYKEKHELLLAEKSGRELLLRSKRDALEAARNMLHQLEINEEKEQLLIRQARHTIAREQIRLETLVEKLETITEQLITLEMPDSEHISALNEKLLQHNELEEVLHRLREQLNALTSELNAEELRYKTEEKQAKRVGETIQGQQLQVQTLLVRASNLLESLKELDAQIDSVLQAIPAHVNVTMREQNLLDIGEKIKRLGAINLAAIMEYDSELQRKRYLDEQYDDLSAALNTLDLAIEKIDKETKQRLQQTFDDVNKAFQSLFPRLFGGGRAMLQLTCDNLLEAGILVMAQPPGKRNSTIHLLSGGEKAMTAVALVFAIFQLNPSPFCMLDEVDAPLDDVNVGRFCALVKEMSQLVQFLFISHNKVTMELADHLIGVTMREPGVSRVVAVDVEQALALTET